MFDEYTFTSREMLRQKIERCLTFWRNRQAMVSFEGRFPSFEIAKEKCGGYEEDTIFEKVKSAAISVKEGKACYERDGYLFYEKDYYLQLLAILYSVFLEYGELNVIDFGGSMGSTYFQNKDKLINIIDKIKWNIVEQKHFVDFGKEYLEDEILKFYYAIYEIEKCNCVIFGSSLQYLENYKVFLTKIAERKIPYLVIDRLPVSNETWVSIEYVHEPIYEASYPLYILSENDLISLLRDIGYVLEQTWIKEVGEVWQVDNKLVKEKTFLFVRGEK